MTATTSSMGQNRTGIATSAEAAARMVEGTAEFPPDAGDETSLSDIRELYAKEAEPLGSVPPPADLGGMVDAVVKKLKGSQPTLYIDKLGERLAFERTGVRLYQALLSKHASAGGFEGGPTLEDLEQTMMEEHQHLLMLTQAVERAGGDPTVMTPSADLHATISKGALEVVVDARTSLAQCLEAMLVVELADNDCWEALVELAEAHGDQQVVAQFERALEEEVRHLENVRAWVAAAQNREPPIS